MMFFYLLLTFLVIAWIAWLELSLNRAKALDYGVAALLVIGAFAWTFSIYTQAHPLSPLDALHDVLAPLPGLRSFITSK